MCYIIESKQPFDIDSMIVTIEKNDMDINFTKIWITSDYDFLLVINQNLKKQMVPFQFKVRFGGYITKITFRETITKPLNCEISDTEYVSQLQCLVNKFIDEHFLPCQIKCLPVQMKGFQYVSTSLINCSKLEDEVCNGGPKVWDSLHDQFPNCLDPCKVRMYKDSRIESIEPMYEKGGQTTVNFELVKNNIRQIEEETLIYDTNDMIGAVGGSLGLFLGFSIFDVICKCLDNLVMPLVDYILS